MAKCVGCGPGVPEVSASCGGEGLFICGRENRKCFVFMFVLICRSPGAGPLLGLTLTGLTGVRQKGGLPGPPPSSLPP